MTASLPELIARVNTRLRERGHLPDGDVSSPFSCCLFHVTGPGGGDFHAIMAREGTMAAHGTPALGSPDCEVTLTLDDADKLTMGQLNAVGAFLLGRIKVRGHLEVATRFGQLLQ